MGRDGRGRRPQGSAYLAELLSAYICKLNQKVKGGWRKAVAVTLTVVLTLQMLLSGGLTQAVAYAYAEQQAYDAASQPVTLSEGSADTQGASGNESAGTDTQGTSGNTAAAGESQQGAADTGTDTDTAKENGSSATGAGSGTQGNATASDGADANGMAASGSSSASGEGENNADGSAQGTDNAAGGASTGADTAADNASQGNGGNADGSDPAGDEADNNEADEDKQEPVAVEAWDWTGRTDNLKFSSPDGLSLDMDALKQQVADAATAAAEEAAQEGAADEQADAGAVDAADAADANDTGDGSASDNAQADQGDTATSDASAETAEPTPEEVAAYQREQLPNPLTGTLSLDFTLDPHKDGVDTGTHTVVLPGDTFTVNLPQGITLSRDMLASDGTLHINQVDSKGNDTGIRIATGTIQNNGSTLKVEFVQPSKDGTTYYVGDPAENTVPATQTEGKQQLASLSASLDLTVEVSPDLVQDDAENSITWTLQTGNDGSKQEAKLTLPTLGSLADQLGIVMPEEDEQNDDTSDAEQSDDSVQDDNADAQDAANGIAPLADEAGDTTITYELQAYNGSASMVVTWCDNNSADRPSIESMSEDFIPQFSLDGGNTWKNLVESLPLVGGSRLTEIAKRELGITDDELDWATFATITRASVGDWDVRSTGLPTSRVTVKTTPRDDDEDGRQDTNDNGELLWNTSRSEPQKIQWRIYDKNGTKPPEGYVYGENDEGPHGAQRYLMRTQTYTFTIEGNLGEDTLKGWFGENFGKDDHAGDFVFRATINGNLVMDEGGHPRTPTIAQMAAAGNLQVSWSDDNTAIITTTLPMYDIYGQPIVYSIQFNDHHEGAEGHDYFQPTYNNADSANHGSATDAVYEDGIMTLRPIGNVSYDATKAWADAADTSQRKDVTFTLWRYSTADGNGPSTAAHVQLNAIDGEAEANAIEYVSVTAQPNDIGPDGTVDLGALLEKKYGEAIHNLPKYDPDGYPYIYALREDTSLAGYETVYGAVQDDGSVRDTGPNWEDINGGDQSGTRGTDDPFIYNGGTVTNRLTGNVPVAATKTWEIAAFQDSLQNVDVTFTAQSRKKATSEPGLLSWLTGGEEEAEWQDVKNEKGEVVTHTLEGFRSETLTQTFTESLPKYDAWGNELEYRWIETGVSINGEPVTFTRDGNGGGTFMLTLENSAGEQEELEFTSTLEVTTDLDTGESQSVVTNTFNNITDQHVDKYWQQPDGTMQQVKPDPNGYPEYPNLDVSGNVTVTIFQNGEKYASFTMDGTTDGDPTFINDGATNPETDPYMQETRSYHADFQNLPKYDENGVLYSYLVLEEGVGGWHTTRTYDPETRTTRMENAVGPGYGSEIRIMKDWIDGADDSHRLDVVVQLVPLEDMQSAADPNKTYKAGEPIDVRAIENTDGSNWINSETDEITLSADNAWFIEAYVPVDDVQYDDFELVEVALVDKDGTRYPVASSATDAEDKYAELAADGFPMDWVNVGWDYQTTETTSRVATPDHVYQTYATRDNKGEYNDDMEAVVATNRRLGLVDLTVTKTWQDGVDPSRPEAELVVSCAEEDGVFHITNNQVWVRLQGGNAVPVTDAEGNTLSASENNIKLEGNVTTDGDTQTGNTLVMTVDTPEDENTSTYEFFGLPKYNGSGDVVHYDVTERWVNGDNVGETGDAYTSSKTVQDVTYGKQHFHDQQQIDFTNTRTGSRNVTFYKNWNDGYVNGTLNQRPDIYLTLYRVTVSRGENNTVDYSDPERVPGYINYTWQGRDVNSSPEYNQSCTIEGLPAYDGEGNAYIYYAQETMSVVDDGASLDYVPVTFDYVTITSSVQEGDAGEKNAVWVGEGDEPMDPELLPTVDGRDWAIHENGTFVNSLTSDFVARGTKLWENVPGNVSQGDLPELTIYLQRKLPNEDWPELTFTKGMADDGSVTWTPGEDQVVAWTSDLHMDANNQYSYQLGYEGANVLKEQDGAFVPAGVDPNAAELPRYDENGALYEYRAIEVPWGLYGKDGGFDDKDLGIAEGSNTTKDLTILHDDNPNDDQLGVVVIEHGETGSFQIRNRYESPEQGNLTVQKHFTGRTGGDLYPTTTFDVYRYYVNEDGVASAADLVASKTFTHDDIVKLVDDNANGNGSFSHTFENLDVFAPDGSYWQYFVVEHSINGYTTTVGIGDLNPDNSGLVPGTERENITGTSSPDLCNATAASEEGKAGAVTGTVLKKDEDVDVTFSNAYEEGTINLSGTKSWADYSNAFGVRPNAEDFKSGLTVTRIGNGGEEDITSEVQDKLTVTDNKDNTFTITLTDMEQWAPDGTAWRYRITENLNEMTIASTANVDRDTAADYYTGTGSSTVTAGTSQTFSLTNRFTGTAAVEKDWVDGDDPYGLRPESVTVRLQARVSGSGGSWQDADDFLKGYVDGGELPTDLSDAIVDKTLSSDRDWKASWTGLPLHAVKSGNVDEIEYRVVEVVDEKIPTPKDPVATGDDGEIYSNVHPYVPAQSVDDVKGDDGYRSVITNTLEGTSVSGTKAWDDGSNSYKTRPTSGGNWQATFFLQRRINEEDWEWVVEAGSDPATSAADPGVVRFTITESMTGDDNHIVEKNDDGSVTVTWKNLPRYDANGIAYSYRLVEQVPGSYDVEDAMQVEDDDTAHRYYVVGTTGGNPDSQSFTNDLRTTSLTGTKKWDDTESSLIPELGAGDLPTMTLHRAYKRSNGSWASETVTYQKNNGQPTWTDKNNKDGVWEFSYTGLPAANSSDQQYVYWAEETAGSVDGFYPLYGSDNATKSSGADGTAVNEAATAGKDGSQTNEPITNVPTRLTLVKVSDFENDPVTLTNIELSVIGKDDGKTYAVWTNGESGSDENVKVWINGTTVTDPNTVGYVEPTYTRVDGLIVGLGKGDYIVRETGNPPTGYAPAADVALHINADGTAKTGGAVTQTQTDGAYTIKVTVTDPVLRGHLQLTKRVSDDGTFGAADATALSGATFDLYRTDIDGDDKPELIASDLVTNGSGQITTRGNSAAINKWTSKAYDDEGNLVASPEERGAIDLTYGSKYSTLTDGLPEGTYYFVETNVPASAVTPDADDAKTDEVTIDQNDHQKTLTIKKGNEEFTAQVTLHKYDTATGAALDGAVFSVSYTPEGGRTKQSLLDVKSGADGTVTFSDLKKGTYTVTEKSNTGYDMTMPFSATFTIGNEDHEREFVITSADCQAAEDIDFTVTSGSYTADDNDPSTGNYGIPNTPKRGTLTMTKQGNGSVPLSGVTFELQRKGNDNTWTTIAKDLVTGQSYAMNDGNTGLEGEPTAGSAGVISVSNLMWGTYRFVETESVPGYVGEANGEQIKSDEATINRDNVSGAVNAGTVVNDPTSLEINKRNDAGEVLAGAEFEVRPADGSTVGFADPDNLAKGTYDSATNTITLTTDSTGRATLTGQLMVGETYTIYESKAPTDYDPADGTLTITVAEDGLIKLVGNMPERYEIQGVDGTNYDGLEPGAIIVTNLHEAIELVKVDSTDNNKPLEGAEFTLAGLCMDGNTSHTYTTDKDGKIAIDDGLLGSTAFYTLSETKAPDGYVEMSESFYFRMDERGDIVPVELVNGQPQDTEELPEGWSVNEGSVQLTAENDPVKLQITKVGPDDKLLEDAVFSVKPIEGSKLVNDGPEIKMTTDKNGVATSTAELIVGNTYDITEITAPEGYEKVSGTMRIIVDDDGSIRVLGSVLEDGSVNPQPPTGYERVDSDNDGTPDNAFEVRVKNNPVEISLVKLDADNTDTKLAGGVFEITGDFAGGSDDSEKRTFTTNADGTLVCKGETLKTLSAVFIVGREYTIEETQAPAGFEKIEGKWTFKVEENGFISPSSTDPASGEVGFAIGTDKVTIMALDEPIEASLSKVGTDGVSGATMADAQFELVGNFVDQNHNVVQNKTLTLSTGITGELRFADMRNEADPSDNNTYRLIGGGAYQLTETIAPAGYEKIDGTFTFTVGTDGKLSAAGQASKGAEGYRITGDDSVTITATDTPIKVQLQKTGSNTEGQLNGAVFSLYRVNDDETETLISNEIKPAATGAVELTRLVGNGAYCLHETTAPAGYELVPDLTFTVDENGAVKFQQSNYWSYSDADGTFTITATDPAIELMFNKKDLGKGDLTGATFKISGKFVNTATHVLDTESRDIEFTMDGSASTDLTALASGDATYSVVANQSYTIEEVTAPKGYDKLSSFTFKVNAGGTISEDSGSAQAPAGQPGYVIDNSADAVVLTAHDEPIELVIKKQGSDGAKNLVGAEFVIAPAAGSAFASTEGLSEDGSLKVTVEESSATGRVPSAMLIAGNTYDIQEVKAPNGYELAGTARFKVTEDGADIKLVSQSGDGSGPYAVSVEEGMLAITATDEPIQAALVKTDLQGMGLSGAKFTLAGMFVNTKTHETDKAERTIELSMTDSAITLNNMEDEGGTYRLVAGNAYVLTETAAPAGHELISGSLKLMVGQDGTLSVTDDSKLGEVEPGNEGYQIDADGVTLIARDTPIEITLTKQANGSDNPLRGAKFTLSGKFLTDTGAVAEDPSTITLDLNNDSASAVITNLVVGETYDLTETAAPNGYEKLGTFKFKVNEHGEVVESSGAGYTVENGSINIVANDTPVEFRLHKLGGGEDGTQPLAGAEFAIYAGEDPAEDAQPILTLNATDGDGYTNISSAKLTIGETYTIREVTAPEGYELAGDATFTVTDGGSIVFINDEGDEASAAVPGKEGSGTYFSADGENGVAVITATNAGIAAQLVKTSDAKVLDPLAGAEFQLAEKDKPETAQTLTVNDRGLTALPGLIAGRTYTLTETKAPAGYELNHTVFEFTVNADGTLQADPDQDGYSANNGKGVITITATDAPIKAQVGKVDESDKALVGAEFTIAPAPGSQFASINGLNPDGSLTVKVDDESGVAQIPSALLVADNTYDIQEAKAPNGYELAGTARFKVTADGTDIKLVSQPTDGSGSYAVSVDTKTGALTVTATDQDIQINLRKVGGAGTELKDAKFELAPATKDDAFAKSNEPITDITPDNIVDKLSAELIAGNSYTLTETAAPAGYELIAVSFTFTVNEDGTIEPSSAENDPAYALGEDGITITATDAQIEIGLIKLGADGTQIAGAHFSLASADDPDTPLVADIVSTAEGTVNIPNLEVGKTYVLTETKAPAGYELIAGSFTFKVEDDGTISIPQDAQNAAAYTRTNKGAVTITVTDTPVELQIEKRAQDKDGALLSGATFQIAPAEGTGTTFADGKADPLSFSTANGLTEVISQQLVVGGTYVLTETASPAGYKRITGSLTFTVEPDGGIKPAEGKGITNDKAFSIAEKDGLVTITATDKPIQIELTKTDLAGNALDGAEFSLTGTFANADGTPAAKPDTQTVTVKDGKVTLENLIATVESGATYTYELTESKAPAGYELIPGTLTFTVDENGDLQNVSAPAGYTANDGTAEITVQDTPVEITVSKVDAAGQPLDGAVFELTGDFRQEDGSEGHAHA